MYLRFGSQLIPGGAKPRPLSAVQKSVLHSLTVRPFLHKASFWCSPTCEIDRGWCAPMDRDIVALILLASAAIFAAFAVAQYYEIVHIQILSELWALVHTDKS